MTSTDTSIETDTQNYDWIPFYKELASTLLDYRSRQLELWDCISDLAEKGYPTGQFEDQDAEKNHIPFTEMDPFTFFGFFTYFYTDAS